MASIEIAELMYPQGHPYRWPTIGNMEDLSAASYEDVVDFFKTYYQPGNASLVVAGDIDVAKTRAAVEKWFADVKPGTAPIGPIDYPRANLTDVRRKTIQDRVQLPRLYLAWVTPSHFAPGDAELDVLSLLLAGGKNSRLYKRMVYDLQIAQDVSAFQASKTLNSEYQIVVTARPGASIDRIRAIVDEELTKIHQTAPTDREFARALNQVESSFYDRMERVGNFGGVGDQLNGYYFAAGNPGYFTEDLARYRALSPADISAIARTFLPLNKRVELVVEPGQVSTRTDGFRHEDHIGTEGYEVLFVVFSSCGPLPRAGHERRGPAGARSLEAAGARTGPVAEAAAGREADALERAAGLDHGPDRRCRPCISSWPFRAGIGADPAGKFGLASLTADMIDEGAGSRAALEIADAVDFLGAELSGERLSGRVVRRPPRPGRPARRRAGRSWPTSSRARRSPKPS